MKAYGLAQQTNSQKRAAFLAVFADRVAGFLVLNFPLTLNGIGLREGTYVALLLPFAIAKAMASH